MVPHRTEPRLISRNSSEFILFVADSLDLIAKEKKVLNTFMLDRCDVCYDRVTGHFDESKLQFVPGGLRKLLQVPSSIRIRPGDFGVNPKLREIMGNSSYGAYELRQLIVRSGVYHSDQLSGLRFTEHELSVNAASFLAARSEYKECSCNGLGYGLTNPDRVMEDTPYLIQLGPDPTLEQVLALSLLESERHIPVTEDNDSSLLTKVEKAFTEGKDIPTGRRKRSPEAQERRKRSRSRNQEVTLLVHPHVPKHVEIPQALKPDVSTLLRLTFPSGTTRKFKRRIPRRRYQTNSDKTYWYRLRNG